MTDKSNNNDQNNTRAKQVYAVSTNVLYYACAEEISCQWRSCTWDEGAKVIEKHVAQLCVLAEDFDQPDYVKLSSLQICKINSEGNARKVIGCSCLVVKDYGEPSEGLHIVQEYVKSH
ncbi:hypothetical protein QQ045_001072 [Rhodiola kirilowii]